MNIIMILKKIVLLPSIILILMPVCSSQSKKDNQDDYLVFYNIDWWPHQKSISLKNFQVSTAHLELEAGQLDADAEYIIEVTLKSSQGNEPYIKGIHISETFFNDKNRGEIALIRLTPIAGIVKNDQYSGEEIPVSIKRKLNLKIYRFGHNVYQLECLGKKRFLDIIYTR